MTDAMVPDQDKRMRTLLDQQQALTAYLDALFRELPVLPEAPPQPEIAEVAPTPTPEPAPVLVAEPIPQEEPKRTLLGGKRIDREMLELALAPDSRSAVEEPAVPVPAVVTAPARQVAKQIQRISAPFQALFFNIGGLNLAVPLDKLDGIMNWSKVTRLPQLPPWHLGLIKFQGVTVNIVDTRMLIIPPHRLDATVDPGFRYVILINDKKWGLSCQSVDKVVTLAPDQVKWHNPATGNRPWLAGTVIEQMCALLDVDAFVALLDEAS